MNSMLNFEDRLRTLFVNGEFAKIIALHRLQKKKFKSSSAQHVLAVSYLKTGNFKLAIRHLTTVCRDAPNEERHHHLAVAHLELDNLDTAEYNYKQALQLNPTNYDCLEGLAAIYTKKLMPERTEELLLQMIELRPNSVRPLVNLAVIKNSKLDFFKALEILEKIDGVNYDARYHETYGDTLAGLNRIVDAVEAYEKAYSICDNARLLSKIKSLSPNNSLAVCKAISIDSLSDALAILQIKNADSEQVRQAIEFLESFSGLETDYALIATHLLKFGDIYRAEIFASKSNKIKENASAHCVLGILRSRNEDFSNACAHFFKALEYDDSDADTYNNLALAFWKTHNLEAAIINYNKAIELRPRFVQAISNLALVYKSLAQRENSVIYLNKAKVLMNEALLIDPNNAEAKFNLSLTAMATGHLSLAFHLYENRFSVPDESAGFRMYDEPRVSEIKHSDLKTLLWEEQGLGDTIRFSALINEATKYYKNLIIEVDARLVSIYQRNFPMCLVRETSYDRVTGDYLNDFDQHLPMGDLLVHLYDPKLIQPGPYLLAEPGLARTWKDQLRKISKGRKLIGLQWRSGLASTLRNDYYTVIEDWRDLILDKDYFIVSLNYHNITKEINDQNKELFENIFIPEFDQKNNLEETYALIQSLDLVVTPTSAPGIMASSAGIPNLTYSFNLSEYNFGLVKECPYNAPLKNSNTTFSITDGKKVFINKIMECIRNK